MLPVTGLWVGRAGHSTAGLVVSASLDRTLRLHRLSDGVLLAVVSLPVAATCVVLDAGEHALYAGCSDGGVYEVGLVGDAGAAGVGQLAQLGVAVTDASTASALLGTQAAVLRPHARLVGHARAVTSLAVSLDGELLVSGSEDGIASVWDLRSRQVVRTLQAPSKLPVSCVVVLPQPSHMVPGSDTASGATRTGPKRPSPLAPLVKFPGMAGSLQPWESAPVLLDGSQAQGSRHATGLSDCLGLPQPHQQSQWLGRWEGLAGGMVSNLGLALTSPAPGTADLQGPVQQGQPGGDHQQQQELEGAQAQPQESEASQLLKLRAELDVAHRETRQWQALHKQLQAYVVQSVLSPG